MLGVFLEGCLTWTRIQQHHENIQALFFPNGIPQKVRDFFFEQDYWMHQMIIGNPHSNYWKTMNLITTQYDGVIDGYNSRASQQYQFDRNAFHIINANGDLEDIINAVDINARVDWMKMSFKELNLRILKSGRCSAIVKTNGDFSELYSSHSTWFAYSAMNRIYKNYFFDLSSPFIAAKKLSFSSYPGAIVSIDDFYILSSGITMLETTNGIFNNSLYDLVTPKSLLAWHRVSLANRMATTGKEWADIFSQYNSGTYNNQYMLINYNLFTPGSPLPPGLLWVVEQVPGYVVSGDVTNELERGYWPSYNVPYFPFIYNISGYPAIVDKYGPDVSYQLCPRAKIFRRDQGKITDFDSLKNFMRYNNYQKDPFSKNDPNWAICSRGDFNNPPFLGGCIDTKVTKYDLQSKMISHSLNGPTTSSGLPAFSWSKYNNTIHSGLPDLFNFEFVIMDPQWDK